MMLFPELGHFPNAKARRQALSRATAEVHGLAWVVAFALVAGLVGYWSLAPLARLLSIPPVAAYLGLALFIGVSATALFVVAFRTRIRRSLRRQVEDQGVRLCLACGYDLRLLPHDRCPECGATQQSAPPVGPLGRAMLWVGLLGAATVLAVGVPWTVLSGRFHWTHLTAVGLWAYVAYACRRKLLEGQPTTARRNSSRGI